MQRYPKAYVLLLLLALSQVAIAADPDLLPSEVTTLINQAMRFQPEAKRTSLTGPVISRMIRSDLSKIEFFLQGEAHFLNLEPEPARDVFWESNIANSRIEYILHQSYTSHLECANVVTLNVVISMDGKQYSQQVNGVFTYGVNEQGKLASLRGFWEFDEGLATFKEINAS